MHLLTCFEPDHARAIFRLNGIDPAIPAEKMIETFTYPGSQARTLLRDGIPVACAGIANLEYHRGEAWLLTSIHFRKSLRTAYVLMLEWLPKMAQEGKFIRVQATSFDPGNRTLFEHLGFILEGILRHFGPNGENAFLYSRIFSQEESCRP